MAIGTGGAIRAGRAFVEVFADTSRLARGLKKAEGKLRRFGESVKNLGFQLAKITFFPAAAFALSIKAFADFESSMAFVRARVVATSADFKKLGERAEELGRKTVFSSTEAARAMAVFAQGGFTIDEIFSAIGPSLDLAAVAQIGVAEAVTITSRVLRGMQLDASKAAEVVDVLGRASVTSLNSIEDLGEGLRFVGPLGKLAAISLDEVTAALQILSQGGLPGTLGGTGLRGVLLRLSAPTGGAAKALKGLGIELEAVNGEFVTLENLVDQLQGKLSRFPSARRFKKIAEIFPQRQVAAAAILINAGPEELAARKKVLASAKGAVKELAGIQLNTLTGSVQILRSAVTGLAIDIGRTFKDPFRVAVESLIKLANAAAKWVKVNKTVVAILAVVITAMAATSVSLIALGLGFQFASFVVTGYIAALILAKAATLTFVGVLALLGTPLGVIAALVVVLGVTFLDMSRAVSLGGDIISDVVGWLMERFSELLNFTERIFGGIADAFEGKDVQLAVKILWLSIQVVWAENIGKLLGKWRTFKIAFLQVSSDLWTGFLILGSNNIAGLKAALVDFISFFKTKVAQVQNIFSRIKLAIVRELSEAALENRTAKKIRDVRRGGGRSPKEVLAAEKAIKKAAAEEKLQLEVLLNMDESDVNNSLVDRLEKIATDQKDALEKIATDSAAELAGVLAAGAARDKEFDKKLSDAGEVREAEKLALDGLQIDLDSALGDALFARTHQELTDAAAVKKAENTKRQRELDRIEKEKKDAAAGAEALQGSGKEQQSAVVGTFNAAALLSLRGASLDDREVKLLAEQNRILEQILRAQKKAQPQFN